MNEAIISLSSAKTNTDSAIQSARQAIEEMQSAKLGTSFIEGAQYDLNIATDVQTAIDTALQDAQGLQSATSQIASDNSTYSSTQQAEAAANTKGANALTALDEAAKKALPNASSAASEAFSIATEASSMPSSAKTAFKSAMAQITAPAQKAFENAKSAAQTAAKLAASAQKVAKEANAVEGSAQSAYPSLQEAANVSTPSDAQASLNSAQTAITAALSDANTVIGDMQSAGYSDTDAKNASYGLGTGEALSLDGALSALRGWTAAVNESTAAQQVHNAAMKIENDAESANSDLANAMSSTDSSEAVKYLSCAQDLVSNALAQAKDAIASMMDAGYSKQSIASATYDFETGNAAAKALQNALNDANSWAATNASYAKEKATVADLSESISQMTKQLSNLESIAEELEVDSKILAEPFAWMPSTSKAYYLSAVPSLAERSSQPSSKNLAITGDDAVDVILAAGGLAGLGLVTEAIKKNRERRSGKN